MTLREHKKIKQIETQWMFQRRLLEQLEYKNIAPYNYNEFNDDCILWLTQKNGLFHFFDNDACTTEKNKWYLIGINMLFLDREGYHLCKSSDNNQSSVYKPKDGKFFFLWDNNEFTELSYLNFSFYDSNYNLCKDTFEYIKTENYVAILYHKYHLSESERLKEKPLMDTIISRQHGICHIKVFTYFYKNKIVVDDGNKIIIYDNDFNLIYSNSSYKGFEIWKMDTQSFLVFPVDHILFNLVSGEIIGLGHNEYRWFFAKTYKDIVVFYDENHFSVERSKLNDDWGWTDIPQETPVRNTTGHIFDASFNLLREFNVIGKIIELKEVGDKIAMKTKEYYLNTTAYSYYDVKGFNWTRNNTKTKDVFSIPEITFKYMPFYTNGEYGRESLHLYIVKVRDTSSNSIKSGICRNTNGEHEQYEKIIDCKYDYIKPLRLKDDFNVYYAGIIGKDDTNTFDLYINHKKVFQGFPFDKGYSIYVIANKHFIRFKNCDEKIGIIRNGKVIVEPLYKKIDIYIPRDEYEDYEILNREDKIRDYFFVGSNGKDFIELGWYNEEQNSIIQAKADWKNGMSLAYSDDNVEQSRKSKERRRTYMANSPYDE